MTYKEITDGDDRARCFSPSLLRMSALLPLHWEDAQRQDTDEWSDESWSNIVRKNTGRRGTGK